MEEAGTTSQKATSTGSDRALVLCSHRAWDLEQTRKLLLYRPPDAPDLYGERLELCKVKDCHSDDYETELGHHMMNGEHRLSLRRYLDVTAFPVETDGTPQHKIRTHLDSERMKLLLDLSNAKICSHMSLSDERVLEAYNPNCTYHNRKEAADSYCHCRQSNVPHFGGDYHHGICPDCASQGTVTRFGFGSMDYRRRDDARGYILVAFHWEIDLGSIRASDPGWNLHTIPADEVPSCFEAIQTHEDQRMETMDRHLWDPIVRQRSEPWWEDAEELRCLYDLERVWTRYPPKTTARDSHFWGYWAQYGRKAVHGVNVASADYYQIVNDKSSTKKSVRKDRDVSTAKKNEQMIPDEVSSQGHAKRDGISNVQSQDRISVHPRNGAPDAQNRLRTQDGRPSHLRERLRRLLKRSRGREASDTP